MTSELRSRYAVALVSALGIFGGLLIVVLTVALAGRESVWAWVFGGLFALGVMARARTMRVVLSHDQIEVHNFFGGFRFAASEVTEVSSSYLPLTGEPVLVIHSLHRRVRMTATAAATPAARARIASWLGGGLTAEATPAPGPYDDRSAMLRLARHPLGAAVGATLLGLVISSARSASWGETAAAGLTSGFLVLVFMLALKKRSQSP